MNIEELLALKKADLRKLADEKGIEYNSKTTNADLAEMIYAHNKKAEQDANAQNADVSQAVAETDESAGGDVPQLGNGIFIVPNQLIKVQVRQENGDLVESEMSLDEFLEKDDAATVAMIEARTTKVKNLEASIAVLEAKNTDLETINTALDAHNKSLDEENDKLAAKVVQGSGLMSEKTIIDGAHTHPSAVKPTWKEDTETMLVRVRITPNKGLTSRIRAGMQFGVQYSEHEIDKETFDALINDAYLQVEILESKADG